MLSIPDISLRVVNFIFLAIILGLTARLAASADNNNPQVNFCVFAAAFGLLTSSFYGIIAAFVAAFAWPVILASLDFLNFVFTFSGATALAVAIRTHSCHDQEYLDENAVTQGSTQRCREAQASVAFLYFSVFVFLASMIMSSISMLRGGFFGIPARRNAPRTGVPTMSQV